MIVIISVFSAFKNNKQVRLVLRLSECTYLVKTEPTFLFLIYLLP